MARYRSRLPQLSKNLFLTDGGLETTLVFHDEIDLPEFAAFVLLQHEEGRERLRQYYRKYLDIACEHNLGFILESMTWRASRDWGERLHFSVEELDHYNRAGIELLQEVRNEYEGRLPHIVISGCMGSRGDGYNPEEIITAEEAEAYHRTQITTFRDTQADMVTAFTIPCSQEAIGIVLAAKAEGMPVAISFTVEMDGRLPSGETLKEAVQSVDGATRFAPAYYMINCAHPTHFMEALNGTWAKRIRAIRANASTKSHAELEACTELEVGDPLELGSSYLELEERMQNLNILGGCCGTDHRHVAQICNAFVMSLQHQPQ